jgi:hypothetical protein
MNKAYGYQAWQKNFEWHVDVRYLQVDQVWDTTPRIIKQRAFFEC